LVADLAAEIEDELTTGDEIARQVGAGQLLWSTERVVPDQSSRPYLSQLIMIGIVILVLILGSCLAVLDLLRGIH
jgi:hypothetical protein